MRHAALVKVVIAALSLILCGCGSGNSSAPVSIAGTWQITAALRVGGGIIATVTLSPGVITQTGTSFESAAGSEMDLPENAASPLCGIYATIANGQISGNTVTFNFVEWATNPAGSQVLAFTGTVSGQGNSMFMNNGTYTVPI
ncbi:MAG: hypothetical protein WBP69_13990, partial [Terriglobales bacterium]